MEPKSGLYPGTEDPRAETPQRLIVRMPWSVPSRSTSAEPPREEPVGHARPERG
jgi:hypothetical protein